MPLLVTNRGPEPVEVSDGQHIAVGASVVVDGDVTFCTKRGTSDLQYTELDLDEAARVRARLAAQGRLD